MAKVKVGDRGVDFSGWRPKNGTTLDYSIIKKAGANFILRYSAGTGNTAASTQWKLCEKDEIKRATDADLDFIANSEWYKNRITEGAKAGAADGKADAVFWHSRGLNSGASIYVSLDEDPSQTSVSSVADYLGAYNEQVVPAGYKVDCYAGTPLLAALKKQKVIQYGWRPNATSWSNDGIAYQPDTSKNLDTLIAKVNLATNAHIWQTGNYWWGTDADENVILRTPVGSHLEAAASSGTPDPNPVPVKTHILSVGDMDYVFGPNGGIMRYYKGKPVDYIVQPLKTLPT